MYLRHRIVTSLLVAALGLLGGCAQNAILELQLDLPAAPDANEWFALTQVRNREGHPFDIPWMGGDLGSVQLGSERQFDCISVESDDESADLHVRVRFCRSEDCLDLMDGTPRERWYRLNHPFYIGRRTYHTITIGEVPECEVTADCAVGMCDSGVCTCTTDADCGPGLICEEGNNCVEDVDRCQIEGCIEGVSTTFCSDTTGLHFCETNDNISRDDAVECDLNDP